jgi:hypothetical protein
MITVYQHLEPLNWDVLYLRDSMAVNEDAVEQALKKINALDSTDSGSHNQPAEELVLITQKASDKNDKNPYCLLTLDVRNAWTVPFDVEFTIDNSELGSEDMSEGEILKSRITIQPALTKR